MEKKVLMKGNEAIAEAAIRAGCQCFYGYPITPQTEVAAYMSRKMGQIGRVFIQAESEVSSINMVYGAGGAGVRVMTSTSSPGLSLMAEGISYIVGAEVPCVIVDIARGGPGLGSIQPAQSDYNMVTKGLGHGDSRIPVLAPASIQEMVDLMDEAFDMADKYRTPVILMGDGMIGQMMEPVIFKPERPVSTEVKPWAACGMGKRTTPNIINSLYLDPAELEEHNYNLQKKWKEIEEKEVKYELFNCENADVILVSFGTTSRICHNAIKLAKEKGYNVGLLRPISLWPFPVKAIEETVNSTKKGYIAVEMSLGQMVDDVRRYVEGRKPVELVGTPGGMIPTPEMILEKIEKVMGGEK